MRWTPLGAAVLGLLLLGAAWFLFIEVAGW